MTDSTVIATMSDALSRQDPEKALRELSQASAQQAQARAEELFQVLQAKAPSVFAPTIPNSLKLTDHQHPVQQAAACADSIWNSLSKIASGGSQASLEIRHLESEKAALEQEAAAIETALLLRMASQKATAATLQAKQPDMVAATQALRPWLQWKQDTAQPEASVGKRAAAYAGEYALQQLERSYKQVQDILLHDYQQAVRDGNVKAVGQLTPLLGTMQLEDTAVKLYLQFVKESVWPARMQEAEAKNKDKPLYAQMAGVYNVTVGVLRHHLPLVSHCLYRAQGDVGLVQLVHTQCTSAVVPLWQDYRQSKQWSAVSRKATQIASILQDRYTQGLDDDLDDDAGFSHQIGSLSDVDASLEEAALVIQHAESYLRFLAHSCEQINMAHKIRHDQNVQRRLQEKRQRQSEWDSSDASAGGDEKDTSGMDDEPELAEYKAIEILPPSTQLHQTIAEVGGQYVSVEHCLFLASLQRAFSTPDTEARYYRPLGIDLSEVPNSQAKQTSMVDACWYAARRSTQRAFVTGHNGTASAMANFVADSLTQVVTEVLRHRAEDLGVAHLKPGEGLLVGSAGIFNNASNLIRAGQKTAGGADDVLRRQKVQQQICQACAVINDMEVAIHHTKNLERFLTDTVEKGFPAQTHETEALLMCVKGLSMVQEGLQSATDTTIESLESILRPRIRSIVSEAVGSEGSATAAFIVSPIGGGKADDRGSAGMNYNLDENAYNLVQLREGYISRMCILMDELMGPLQEYLAPRLWDSLWLHAVGTASKRVESFVRKCPFTALGALAFDSDMREWLSYTRSHLLTSEHNVSNQAVLKACPSLSRLNQMARLINIDDLEDVLDLIAASKRKGWDLKEEDAQTFLAQRVDFDGERVRELLRIPED